MILMASTARSLLVAGAAYPSYLDGDTRRCDRAKLKPRQAEVLGDTAAKE
jgi:hypothetical protein